MIIIVDTIVNSPVLALPDLMQFNPIDAVGINMPFGDAVANAEEDAM